MQSRQEAQCIFLVESAQLRFWKQQQFLLEENV
ncbi:hypothetical protein P872_15320 [Rhodonellum psychrophilum GCM71 = DSM 17998]|uniref:Uncharacterized protein n=1 Tax=Rhodonellum psychrophilum GCM71 = DSM 17998 TaxID=1123057 RepID=U5C7F7_9BACT|nr:hypothetical protein P872_15320 [Rhodonellum psychrophilum GCM71 = DSM 17998]